MTSNDYSEDKLIQKSTAELLEHELGWESVFAFDKEVLGENGTLGRMGQHEVLLRPRFKVALKRLNPWLTDKQMEEALLAMTEHMSSASLMQTNEEKYRYIRDGIPVTCYKPNGEKDERRALVIDFREGHQEENDFLAVRELTVRGALYERRADLVCFVNGLPLVFMEVKNHDIAVENAYNDNYSDYLVSIPQLFYYNAFSILSNGIDARIGTIGSKWEFFNQWKRLVEEEAGNIELPTMLRGVLNKKNLLDLVENFILYDHSDGKNVKILARNHQYLGVNQAVEMYRHRKELQGKMGVFWHTQGSGKSYSMLFLAQKIRRKFAGSPTILVLTDREELNTQISDSFLNCRLLGNVDKATKFLATSGSDLVNKLNENPSFIFSLIQKFNQPNATPIYPDHDIVIMSDEAHRTQNGIFAENMMHLLPTACRIGFTGTPLMKDDNITARTFGGYVSVYDFKRAVDDHATVPLYYENRAEKLKELKNPKINEEIAAALDDADLDEEQKSKIEQQFAKEVHLLTAEKRLRIVAKDIVRHYCDTWTSGKAMVVSYNKVTCVRMYNYVQKYWQEEIALLKRRIKNAESVQEAQEMERKLKWMEDTDMAVVVSQEQNEQKTFEKWGLDITPHRKRMNDEELDKFFKAKDNPLRIVFVCAMWLTGFDVPTLGTLYLDKPMKAHTLMQAIARANRVAEGKSNGLIVDYIGIVKALRKALAEYTANKGGGDGNDPMIDKEKLIQNVMETIAEASRLMEEHHTPMQVHLEAMNFERLSLLKDAANALSEMVGLRKHFCSIANTLETLWKYLCQEDLTDDMVRRKNVIVAIHKELQKKSKHVDVTDISVVINHIINDHLDIDEKGVDSSHEDHPIIDISKINFDILRREFAKSKRKNLVMRDLQDMLQERLARMMAVNSNRINFYERYQEIIKEYNQEQDRANIEKTFEELMNLSSQMDEEEKRYVREGFETDEQLAVYDLLFKENLNKEDIKKVKEISKEMLATIKEKVAQMSQPFEKDSTQAEIKNTIRLILWNELPESYPEDSINLYRTKIYEYVSTIFAA